MGVLAGFWVKGVILEGGLKKVVLGLILGSGVVFKGGVCRGD